MFTNARTKKSKVLNAGFQEPNASFAGKNENGCVTSKLLFTQPLLEVGHAVAADEDLLRGSRRQFQF